MKFKKAISFLVVCVVLLSLLATTAGIFSSEGPGNYEYQSIRGETVMIYGKGIYRHMSVELAPQGIAQDFVTLLVGIPLLITALLLSRKNLLKGRLLLAGTLGYFLVTYLFYMIMGMYNELFLVYILLTSTSFFGFSLTILSFDRKSLYSLFNRELPVKFIGGFLIFNAAAIGLMWLSRIVPPLIEGRMPVEVEHYTTLIVQGMDLSILLPLAFLSGCLIIKRRVMGYLMASVYVIFLSILMTALTGKVIGQVLIGVSVGPAIVIIPLFNMLAILCTILIMKNPEGKIAGKLKISH